MSISEKHLNMMVIYFCLFCLFIIHTCQQSMRLGILLDHDPTDPNRELAVYNAVTNVNQIYADLNFSVIPLVERFVSKQSYYVHQIVCRLFKVGVASVLGPIHAGVSTHIQSVCDTKSVPHLQVNKHHEHLCLNGLRINLYPSAEQLGQVYSDMVKLLKWRNVHILYYSHESYTQLQQLLMLPDVTNDISVKIRLLDSNGNYRNTLRQLQAGGSTCIIVDCPTSVVYSVLKQAQQVGMVTGSYQFFFTSLNFHTVDLDDFKFSQAKIYGVNMIDFSSEKLMNVIGLWRHFPDREILQSLNTTTLSTTELSLESALLYDAIHVFAKAHMDLRSSRHIQATSLSCLQDDSWTHGESLFNYLQMVEIEGLTNIIKFDSHGARNQFSVHLTQLQETGFHKVATWTKKNMFVHKTFHLADNHSDSSGLKSQYLIVTTLLKAPYTMLIESAEKLVGNARYEGICVDLIAALAEKLHFNYTLRVAPDNQPGSVDPVTGQWTGMIGELLRGEAHMAIADLTITSEREAVVDFSMQFMNLGISILFRKPTRQPPSLFSFLSPLSPYVWLYMAFSTFAVIFLLFILARFTPYEWFVARDCADSSELLENNFSILNCVWFCIGSLMQQGCDFLPKATSTRMVAGTWWFFTLIMISSYTANLAAFLTIERMVSPIESVEDLARQEKIKYGLYGGGSTATFFRNSTVYPYNKMWRVMSENADEVFLDTAQGIEKVKDSRTGQYAYFMESSTIEYVTERECDLTQVGGLLDNKGYGIALPPNSPWTNEINEHIVFMKETGQLSRLKNKWWLNYDINCVEDASSSTASALNIENVGGVFVCLLGGLVAAVIIALLEFIWYSRTKLNLHNTAKICQCMCNEMVAVFTFRGSKKKAMMTE